MKVIRAAVEELALLNDAKFCQELVGGPGSGDVAKYEIESIRLIRELRTLMGVRKTTTPPQNPGHQPKAAKPRKTETTPVRIRLSTAVVRILQAFGSTGRRPEQMVERALWNDSSIQDASLLLGIAPPDASLSAKPATRK